MTQCNELLKILHKYEDFFDGTFFTWRTDPVYFELKQDANPICSRPYPLLKVHEEIFKNEVERLVILVVIEVANDLEWGAPSFAQPKPKSNRVMYDYYTMGKISVQSSINGSCKLTRHFPTENG